MNEISGIEKDGRLVIALSGHIDSTNSAEVEAEIGELRAKYPPQGIVIDAEKLEYISSAGLRVILRLRKDDPQLEVINTSSAVYEVFEMTGFTEMLPVKKAYRAVSIDGCEVIGRGANGTVYRLDPDTIIKVYKDPDSLDDIHRERELARKAFVLGIPTAMSYDVVKVGDGYGSVFEMLNADSFASLVVKNPENLDAYVELFVDLLKKIHSTEVKSGDMPDMKKVAVGWAEFMKDYLEKEQAEKLLALVKAVPERNTMIHGDYHLRNIMLQGDEVLLIDMDTLAMGHPVFELASMYLGFVGFGEADRASSEKFMGFSYDVAGEFWNKALRRYLGTDDENAVREVQDKCRIIAYNRLMRRTIRRDGFNNELGLKTINMCKEKLADLLGRVDSLDF